jgi:hypothetical protein
MSSMTSADKARLADTLLRLYGCRAVWESSKAVRIDHQGRIIWKGEVHTYELLGHLEATKAYAWRHRTDAGRERSVAILGGPQVKSPEAAVRASIALDSANG